MANTDQIRQESAKRVGLNPDAVMVHATQTHSAPGLGHFMVDEDFKGISNKYSWLRGSNEEYSSYVLEKTLEAIRLANENLEPVKVGAGSGIEGRMAFNRRAVMRDGTISMPGRRWEGPLGPTNIRYIEGPMDPELGVVCFRTESLRIPAILVNYTCHPVSVFGKKTVVSADWPGALAEELTKTCGKDCIPLVLNGCCGNINPWPPFDPDYVEDHRKMGTVLARTAEKVIETLDFKEEKVLDWKTKHLKLPLREVEPERLDKAIKILSQNPEPVWTDETHTRVSWDWFQAVSVYSVQLLKERESVFDYEIQAFRIGNTAFVGLPGEPFVEGQLKIKLNSPAYSTYVLHMINHYVGYIPTKEAQNRGGHEDATTYWSKLVPESLDRIVEASLDLLKNLFPK